MRFIFHWPNFNVSRFVLRLQKFKLNIANTVISQDNSSLMTMDTGQLLDLFTVDKEKKKEKASTQQNETGKASLKSVLENLGELWEEEQYETEYNLDNFIESLKWSVLNSVLDKIQNRTDHLTPKSEEQGEEYLTPRWVHLSYGHLLTLQNRNHSPPVDQTSRKPGTIYTRLFLLRLRQPQADLRNLMEVDT